MSCCSRDAERGGRPWIGLQGLDANQCTWGGEMQARPWPKGPCHEPLPLPVYNHAQQILHMILVNLHFSLAICCSTCLSPSKCCPITLSFLLLQVALLFFCSAIWCAWFQAPSLYHFYCCDVELCFLYYITSCKISSGKWTFVNLLVEPMELLLYLICRSTSAAMMGSNDCMTLLLVYHCNYLGLIDVIVPVT